MMNTLSDHEFAGFSKPEANFFRLPNEWTDMTANVTSGTITKNGTIAADTFSINGVNVGAVADGGLLDPLVLTSYNVAGQGANVAAARGSSWFSRNRASLSWKSSPASTCWRTGRACPSRKRS